MKKSNHKGALADERMQGKRKVQEVFVITQEDSDNVLTPRVFANKKDAEELFVVAAKEIGLKDDEVNDALDDGWFSSGGWTITINSVPVE
jgi:hypothetical protein